MASLVELSNEWEIQLLVILSFTLQMFLFFTGGLRRRTSNMLLRLSIWISYLGADLVAVYALGFLSRHKDATNGCPTLRGAHQLAFLWAPFLLIHLGGQDTITAFSIEDNNLWLRHLLNLVVQVVLALYVLWKSTGWHNMQLLVPGIFVFIAGIIKYGERTLALMYADLRNTRSSVSEQTVEKLPHRDRHGDYSGIVCLALKSAPFIRDLFGGRGVYDMQEEYTDWIQFHRDELGDRPRKLLEVELAMAYDDLYTKAVVLRTRTGLILRCVSQVSMVVALVLFHVSSKQRYSRVDVAITYALFLGGILLEGCAVCVMLVASPWTWAWLGAREYRRLARMSWLVLSWAGKRPLWSNSMGQYSLRSYMGTYQQSSLSQRVMIMIRKMASRVGVGKERLLWLSKLLDTEYIQVDDKIIKATVQFPTGRRTAQYWPNLGPFLKRMKDKGKLDWMPLGNQIVYLHLFTEAHLSKYDPSPSDMEANATKARETAASVNALVHECRKLSNYMLYLFVAQPSMLLVTGILQDTFQTFSNLENLTENDIEDILQGGAGDWRDIDPPASKETLEEIKDMWIRFLLYVAGKSRPEAHAAQLSRGGELLTFAWLLMAHYHLGDVGRRIQLTQFFEAESD